MADGGGDAPVPYAGLTPDVALDAVESRGLRCDGRFLALNSYENRVYQIGLEEGGEVVAKFYRPGRWTDAAILEEHAFTQELAGHEIPVVAPLADAEGRTLTEHAGYRFALFPKQPGRTPEFDDPDTLTWMGRFMGRIHAVGKIKPFAHRPALNAATFGDESLAFVREGGFLPPHVEASYVAVAQEVLRRVRLSYAAAEWDPDGGRGLRLHGDCHPGNILWTRDGPHFVDFDDCRTGPAIQDLWMLLSGDHAERQAQFSHVLEGYAQFCDFDPRELCLVEALRALRMLHHSAWIARRWSDPAFQASFPWFGLPRYWEEQILSLREQAAMMDEPPLEAQ